MKTILCKEGYLIEKSSIDDSTLKKIKKRLTVKPHVKTNYSVNQEVKEFEVYQENDKYLNIPKFYGLKKYGQPEENKELKGKKLK